MRVLGLDPGTITVGYGVLDQRQGRIQPVAYGVVKAHRSQPNAKRLGALFRDLEKIVKKYQPDKIAIEKVFFGVNVKAAIALGEGRGMALVAADLCDVDVFEFSPTQIKQAVTGNGRAHKTQIQYMIKNLLSLKDIPESPDAADALAVAYCFLNYYKVSIKVAQ